MIQVAGRLVAQQSIAEDAPTVVMHPFTIVVNSFSFAGSMWVLMCASDVCLCCRRACRVGSFVQEVGCGLVSGIPIF